MESKHKIIHGCIKLLQTKGTEGLSVRSVAKEAGVNHGLVHHYFGSFESMLIATLEYLADSKRDEVLKYAATSPEQPEKFMADALDQGDTFFVLIGKMMQISSKYPLLRARMAEILKIRMGMLQQLLGCTSDQAILFQACFFGLLQINQIFEGSEKLGEKLLLLTKMIRSHQNAKETL